MLLGNYLLDGKTALTRDGDRFGVDLDVTKSAQVDAFPENPTLLMTGDIMVADGGHI